MKWTTIGIIIGALGAFFYGTYSIFSKIAILRGYHSFTVTVYSLTSVGIVLLPFTDWFKIWEIIQIEPIPMSGFLLLHSLITSVLPYICFTIGLNYIEAGKLPF